MGRIISKIISHGKYHFCFHFHGEHHPQFWPGYGKGLKPVEEVSTGIGCNTAEAAKDCMEALGQSGVLDIDLDEVDISQVVSDLPHEESQDGCWIYVTVDVYKEGKASSI